ncbi:MAG: hypothetical protein IT494_01610 [Gammaproteobacteria bacterium]|nr:hypothetical protein [Gammaproteobacteria bacterium]
MNYLPPFPRKALLPSLGVALALLAAPGQAQQPDSFAQAFRDGKVDAVFRLRYENVDEDIPTLSDTGEGLTLRTVLGFTTGSFHSLSVRLAAQDVRAISDNYNDGTGRVGAKTWRPTIADPSATSLLEGYVSYDGLSNTTVKFGRQLIEHRAAPMHRFVGPVVWRQNWQAFDAVTLQNKSLKDLTLSYSYVWQVHRVLTDKAIGALSEWDSNTHLFNAAYQGLPIGKLEGYYYQLHFANAAASSTATWGLRLSGERSANPNVKLVYSLEYARQTDSGSNPNNGSESYLLGELGFVWTATNATSGLLRSVGAKVGYEQLDGNGTMAFVTPLATLHAFQGWADKFLTTPRDGVKDLQLAADANLAGNKVAVVWHSFESANANYDYGSEIDAQISRTFNQNWSGGLKIARYNADGNATNVARNGLALSRDTNKFWAWVEFKY